MDVADFGASVRIDLPDSLRPSRKHERAFASSEAGVDCVAERARVRHCRGEGSAARPGRRRVAGRVLGVERGDQVRDFLRMGREREVAGVKEMKFCAWQSAAMIEGAELKVYAGAPHGITDTHKEQLSADLLAFVNSIAERTADERQRLLA